MPHKVSGIEVLSQLDENQYPVMEHFYTIQGEGHHSGKAAYFIRLAGCDVGCVWCDVKESWDIHKDQIFTAEDLKNEISSFSSDMVVITGGEPLMHDLTSLTCSLKSINKKIHIETSGAHPLSGDLDWITLSPKKFASPLEEVIEIANELKVIIFNKSDFEWAEQFAEQVPKSCYLYLQPEWGKRNEMMPLIVDYVKTNPKWNISLQSHKYLNVP